MCNGIGINLISTLLGAVTGAVIGAGASIYATKVTVKSQFELLDKKDEKEAQATTCAIISELHALKNIFDIEITPKIMDWNLSFNYQYKNISNYFSIFDANINKVGKISNKDLRECIVNIHVSMKYFLDCLRTNNEIDEEGEGIVFKQNCLLPTYNKIINLFKNLEELENCKG